jgi:hypothetical protein
VVFFHGLQSRTLPTSEERSKVLSVAADYPSMTIPSTLSAQSPVEQAALVLKKTQDVTKAEGQALVALIETSSPGQSSGRIDVYA